MFRITWMATACFALCAASADAQEFLGLPPEQYRQDPKTLEAKEQQLRAALAEPGFHVSDRNPQTWELIQTLTMAGKFQEAIAVWKPIVSRSREMGRYEGEVRESRDLFDLAELHFRAGEQEKAADIYRERIANYTEHFGAKSVHALFVREQLMTLYMRGKNYEKAIAEWEKLRNDLSQVARTRTRRATAEARGGFAGSDRADRTIGSSRIILRRAGVCVGALCRRAQTLGEQTWRRRRRAAETTRQNRVAVV